MRLSGPLHAILRIEGTCRYSREDNRSAPFLTRIRAWAGTPDLRIVHAFPCAKSADRHPEPEGQHALVAIAEKVSWAKRHPRPVAR